MLIGIKKSQKSSVDWYRFAHLKYKWVNFLKQIIITLSLIENEIVGPRKSIKLKLPRSWYSQHMDQRKYSSLKEFSNQEPSSKIDTNTNRKSKN